VLADLGIEEVAWTVAEPGCAADALVPEFVRPAFSESNDRGDR